MHVTGTQRCGIFAKQDLLTLYQYLSLTMPVCLPCRPRPRRNDSWPPVQIPCVARHHGRRHCSAQPPFPGNLGPLRTRQPSPAKAESSHQPRRALRVLWLRLPHSHGFWTGDGEGTRVRLTGAGAGAVTLHAGVLVMQGLPAPFTVAAGVIN